MGPNLKSEIFASGEWLESLLTGKLQEVGADGTVGSDVRDVAYAHLQAIKVCAAANRRFIITSTSPSWAECARPIIMKYAPLGWPVTQKFAAEDPNWKPTVLSNFASREILGIEYRDWCQTMLDMADAMVALGTIQKPAAPQ